MPGTLYIHIYIQAGTLNSAHALLVLLLAEGLTEERARRLTPTQPFNFCVCSVSAVGGSGGREHQDARVNTLRLLLPLLLLVEGVAVEEGKKLTYARPWSHSATTGAV